MKKYETFDHTADLGIRAFGRTRDEVFANAAYALFDLLIGLDKVREELSLEVQLEAADPEDLLVRWLGELLFLCNGEGYLFKKFSFSRLEDTSLTAMARGERFDPSRHEFKMEIKAVTYHQIAIKRVQDRWEARIILDI